MVVPEGASFKDMVALKGNPEMLVMAAARALVLTLAPAPVVRAAKKLFRKKSNLVEVRLFAMLRG